ncbi:MAG: hypothetical protein WBA77_23530 [Microcoleaceae cyanobacterium]
MSLFPDDQSNPLNGYRSTEQLDPLKSRYNSEPNEIEDVDNKPYDPETVKVMQKSFIFLIIAGVLVGSILAAGLIYVLNKLDIDGKPPQVEQIQSIRQIYLK